MSYFWNYCDATFVVRALTNNKIESAMITTIITLIDILMGTQTNITIDDAGGL